MSLLDYTDESGQSVGTTFQERLFLSTIHELANLIDGTRRYVRILLDEIPEDDIRRVHAENAENELKKMSAAFSGAMDSIREILDR